MKIKVTKNFNRLDKFIYLYLQTIPLSLIQKLIRINKIKINNKKSKANSDLIKGDIIYIYYNFEFIDNPKNEIKLSYNTKKKFKDRIIYQNENFLVVNKLIGYSVQRGSKIKYSLKDFYESLLKINLYIVHRLDKDTSGLMLFAKNKFAAASLSKLFESKAIIKYYTAVTNSKFYKKSGTLINKNSDNKDLKLLYRKINIENFENCYLIKLITGKKHQIRLQFYLNKNPIKGDKKFNNISYDRLLLSSTSLKFKYDNKIYIFKLKINQTFL